jgi:hypothetical protein
VISIRCGVGGLGVIRAKVMKCAAVVGTSGEDICGTE